MKNQKQEISKEFSKYVLTSSSSKIASINKRYPELEWFRDQLYAEERNHYYKPYSEHKKSANTYRAIFMAFSLLFFVLLLIATGYSAGVVWLGYLGVSLLPKTCISILCALLSLSSLVLGWKIRPEKEAVYHFLKRAQHSLAHIFDCHGMQHTYHEIMDKMQEMRDSTLAMLDQVINAKDLEAHLKEKLCNQAVLELRDQLHALLRSLT